MTVSKSKLTRLRLVYPPISNQEAYWLKEDPEVERYLRKSNFYMICGRPEIFFEELQADKATSCIHFSLKFQGSIISAGYLEISELLSSISAPNTDTFLELGDKLIRIWNGKPKEPDSILLDWFTADKLLLNKWHKRPGIYGFDNYRELTNFDLLYTGIATESDSFGRLIDNGHQRRMEILANEPQRFPGARVTDEIFLLLFDLEPLIFTSFEPDHVFTDEDFAMPNIQKSIIADAEKAFVHTFKPEYNDIHFKRYPKGKDGLYETGFLRYGYVIAEDITLITPHGQIKGACPESYDFINNEADAIFIDGQEVNLFVSGKDFPRQNY